MTHFIVILVITTLFGMARIAGDGVIILFGTHLIVISIKLIITITTVITTAVVVMVVIWVEVAYYPHSREEAEQVMLRALIIIYQVAAELELLMEEVE
jgi:hypothetical protein